ncbi:MAG: TonB-dependent receptor, partial [Myxococcaceae bacterium]|nr:TonB-dependent receptor [Myxococcaceae bacterium]
AFADAGPVEGQALDAGPSDAGVVEPGPLDAGEVAALAVDAGIAGDGAAVALTTVVTGSRTPSSKADAVVATEVITRAQIEASNARDLGQLLQQAQGVETTDSFRGTGVRLQGLDSEYVLLLIDGERINGRVGNVIDLSRFTLANVERVEIVKGPSAALYGADAIGGVINLITRRPQRPLEAMARFQLGTSGGEGSQQQGADRLYFPQTKLGEVDARGMVAGKLGFFDGRLNAGYHAAPPYFILSPTTENPGPRTAGPGVVLWYADAELGAKPTASVDLVGKLGYLRRDTEAVDLGVTGAVFDRRGRQEQFDASLKATVRPQEGTTVMVRGRTGLFRDQLLQDQRGAIALDAYSRNLDRLYEAEGQVDHRFGDANLATGGASYLQESLLSTRIGVDRAVRHRAGFFVQDAITLLGKRLELLPGLRLDLDSQFGAAPSPRVAVKFEPAPAFTLRASFGLGFRPPSFTELYLLFENTSVGYVVQGNPALRPEHSIGTTVAVDWRPPLEGWNVSLGLFRTDLTDLISVDTTQPPNPENPTLFTYRNVSRAYTQGAELQVRMRLARAVYFDLGYLLNDARDVEKARALEGRSAHRGTAALTARYRKLGLELTVRGTLNGARPFYVDENGDGLEETQWAKTFADLDVTAGYTFREWLRFFVTGYNLFNAGDVQYLPRPPRGVIGGVQVNY